MTERLRELLAIMARLRGPDGCPWDRVQTFASIAPYTIEESYEVADAAERNDMPHLRDELGDLLFQVVFHAHMAQEAGHFDFDGVVRAICDKLVRRHPHVFGGSAKPLAGAVDVAGQSAVWENIKAQERAAAAAASHRRSHADRYVGPAVGVRVVGQRDVSPGTAASHVAKADAARWGDVASDGANADAVRRGDVAPSEGALAGAAPGALSGVPLALPALMRAFKLSKRAARVGFDFEHADQTADKVAEELAEVREAAANAANAVSAAKAVNAAMADSAGSAGVAGMDDSGETSPRGTVGAPAPGVPTAEVVEEVGDLLFAVANLARKLEVDPEAALRAANKKFERRFNGMERLAAQRGEIFERLDLAAQEALWQAVKRGE